MSKILTLPLESFQPDPASDTQARLLHNALTRFCDRVISDQQEYDDENNVLTREVEWQYGASRFRAKLVTFDGQTSICQYDYSPNTQPLA